MQPLTAHSKTDSQVSSANPMIWSPKRLSQNSRLQTSDWVPNIMTQVPHWRNSECEYLCSASHSGQQVCQSMLLDNVACWLKNPTSALLSGLHMLVWLTSLDHSVSVLHIQPVCHTTCIAIVHRWLAAAVVSQARNASAYKPPQQVQQHWQLLQSVSVQAPSAVRQSLYYSMAACIAVKLLTLCLTCRWANTRGDGPK